jgi:signal peptide peptidase SppA
MSELKAWLADFDNQSALYSPTHFETLAARLQAADLSAAALRSSPFEAGKPFPYRDGIATIPVVGVLVNRFNYVSNWVSGYDGIRTLLDAALADNDVKGIAFDVNCHGGMVQGCFELADYIYSKRGVKPMQAIVDANAHSAAYAIASSVGKIVATRSASVGSVGVVRTHVDYSKSLDAEGVKVTYIYAGKHKVDGNPYEKLSKDVRDDWQAEVEKMYDEFVATVARNRGISEDDVRETEAAVFRAEDALEKGLIDEVNDPIEAFAAFSSELTGSMFKPKGVIAMAEDIKDAAASTGVTEEVVIQREAKAASEARDAERSRIKGILASPEATGREALAQHFAFDTALPAEAVEAALKAAPIEKAGAAAAANLFEAAMSKGNPEVGAGDDAATAAATGEEDVAARILKSWSAATGIKLN